MARPRSFQLAADDVPVHARQLHVLSGYRTPLRPREALSTAALTSLCIWHNETANVWSHLLGLLWALTRLTITLASSDAAAIARYSVACFHFSAAVVFTASSTAHLLAPLLPLLANNRLWLLDHTAIIVAIGGSYVPGLLYGFRCHLLWRNVYSTTVTAGLTAGVVLTLRGVPPDLGRRSLVDRLRIIVLTSVVAFGLVPLAHWCTFASPGMPARVRTSHHPGGAVFSSSRGRASPLGSRHPPAASRAARDVCWLRGRAVLLHHTIPREVVAWEFRHVLIPRDLAPLHRGGDGLLGRKFAAHSEPRLAVCTRLTTGRNSETRPE